MPQATVDNLSLSQKLIFIDRSYIALLRIELVGLRDNLMDLLKNKPNGPLHETTRKLNLLSLTRSFSASVIKYFAFDGAILSYPILSASFDPIFPKIQDQTQIQKTKMTKKT